MDRFGRAFPTAYEETFTVNQGLADLAHLDRLGDGHGTSVALYRPADAPDDVRRFKLFRVDPLSLTDILPIFTHMGVEVVDEQPFEVARADGTDLHVYDFGLRVPDAAIWEECPHDKLRDLFEGAVAAVWDGRAESDGFNRLVLAAQLTWRQVVVLRAVAKYLRQTRATFSQNYLEDALVSHPAIARDLVDLWQTRFDPQRFAGERHRRAHRRRGGDRRPGGRRPRRGVLARPRPHHPGVPRRHPGRPAHELLPAGRRRRAEVVRLAQAEPQGRARPAGPPPAVRDLGLQPARRGRAPALRPGGPRRAALDRPARGLPHRGARPGQGADGQERRHRADRLQGRLLPQAAAGPRGRPRGVAGGGQGGLPDVHLAPCSTSPTTASSGAAVPPEHVVRHDGDDVYLVVAADKGTATFSDIANGVAQSYGFWLDDAFASGGSAGYDHKAMGITARGAWESVKRHFREMGVDTQSQDFTVVGVGDMSGDVFGNGMLLSEHIRLVAAFDHRHVFVDPTPGCRGLLRRAPSPVRPARAPRGTTTTSR